MLIVYGSMLCKDCVECIETFDRKNIAYEYRELSESLQYMKDFLAYRDTLPIFDEVKKEGRIGIPCIVREDGTVTLDFEEFM